MRMKQILGSVAILAVACAFADGRGYEPRAVTINAGVIAFGPGDTAVRDVYTFYVMDRRTDLKPLGLVFRNPFAPAREEVSPDPRESRPITRDQALYWIVDISRLTDAQLARYQILLLSRTDWSELDDRIREKLRRFVDGGGMLWVEVSPTTRGDLWFPRVSLQTTPDANRPVDIVNLNHPLLRGYYTLSPSEVAQLGLRGRGFGGGALNLSAADPVLQIVSAVNADTPVIAAATYGSGRIVVSAARIAGALNAPFTNSNGSLVPRASDFRMEAVPDLELKFAYNIIRWAGAGSSDAFNPRRANAVADQYGAPLAVRWRDRNTTYSLQNGTPLIYGGLVFVVSGNKLICYDAVPKRDLDGDGRADDGVIDLERGERFDKVWEATLPGQASPPVAWESPDGVNVIVTAGTAVYAYRALPRDNQGLIPPVGQIAPGWPLSNPAPGASPPTTGDGQVPAPIVIENKLLIVPSYHSLQGSGQTAGFYAVLLTSPPRIVETTGLVEPRWYLPRNTGAGDWLLPPVTGYVPNLGQGGGSDLVIYFGTRRNIDGAGGTVLEGVQAFWLGAKGERLIPEINANDIYQGRLRTRLSGRGTQMAGLIPEGVGNSFRPDLSNPLCPRVYELGRDSLGNPTRNDITNLCRFNGQGEVILASQHFNSANTYVIDYFIDWARPAQFNVVFRTFASLPAYNEASSVPPQKLRGFTLAPNGVLYITTGTEQFAPDAASGNIIALQEQLAPAQQQARGGSRVLWRWQSHGGYQQVIPGPERTEPVVVPPSTIYNEPNEYFMRFVGNLFRFNHNFVPTPDAQPQRRWMNFAFVGAPIYYDGAVYAIAQGQARIGPIPAVPYLVLLALDAEPEQFVIDLGAPLAALDEIRISQRDYGRSGPSSLTNIISTLTYSPNAPNPDIKVVSTFTGAQIRITSFAQAGGSGQLNLLENVLSISQPVLVNVGGNTPLWIDPDRIAGNWNNLRWYAVFLGQRAQANPVLVGDTLYIPSQITVPTPNGLETYGGILGIAADPYPLQPDLAQRKDQAGTIPRVDPANPLRYQSIIRWPFIDDLFRDFEEDPDPISFLRELFRRFANGFQAGTDLSPIAVGDGLLVISSSEGLQAYSRQSTVIADEGRLLEVDTAGRVVWSTENTQLDIYTGSIAPSKARYGITPNARVYRYGENELLVVEPERNRVVILDRAGAETRTITRFIPDRVPLRNANGEATEIVELRRPDAFNSNYISGAPEALRHPTDVTVWTEFVPAERNPYAVRQPLEYWIHYTITDTGNGRVVDIVDRYVADPNTFTVGGPVQHPQLGAMLGVLYWMTPAQRQERAYRYVSAQRFEYWDGTQTRVGFATLVQNAAVSGFEARGGTPTPEDPASPEAGMITLQLIVNGRDQTVYIRRMALPDGRIVPILAPVALDTAKRSASGNGNPGLYLLVTTSTGVYELAVPLREPITDTLPVTWMLTNEAYTNHIRRQIGGEALAQDQENRELLRPILFKPRQARYLDNGNVLIVNAYSGTTLVQSGGNLETRDFPGEVFEIDANDYRATEENLGFSNSSILWSTLDRPRLSGSHPLRKPSSADRGGF